MTIVTKPLTAAKEKKEKEALESLVTIDNNDKNNNPGETKDEPDLNLAFVSRSRSQRSPVCLTLCLLLLALIGLMSGAYIYKSIYSRR